MASKHGVAVDMTGGCTLGTGELEAWCLSECMQTDCALLDVVVVNER